MVCYALALRHRPCCNRPPISCTSEAAEYAHVFGSATPIRSTYTRATEKSFPCADEEEEYRDIMFVAAAFSLDAVV